MKNCISRLSKYVKSIQLQGKGILKGGFAEWLREKSGGSKLTFLFILLGIIPLGASLWGSALVDKLKEQ